MKADIRAALALTTIVVASCNHSHDAASDATPADVAPDDASPPDGHTMTTGGIAVTPQFFGQHWSTIPEWPSISFGAGKFGPGIEWNTIEPSQGTYKFGSLDSWIVANALAGHQQDMTFMYAAIHTPSWAGGTGHRTSDLYTTLPNGCLYPPLKGAMITDCSLKEYLTAVLDHVCTGTAPHKTCSFTSWELHNEVNANDTEWIDSYADLAQMDADALATIKGQCESCIVLGANVSAGGDGSHAAGNTSPEWDTFLIAYLAAWPDGAQMPDALSWHPYPSRDNLVNIPFPETYAGSDCPAGAPNPVCRQTVVDQIQRIRQIADAVPGMAGKPIWATEGGFVNTELVNANPTTQSELRAAYVARYLLALASGGVAREFWYEWEDPTWGSEWDGGHITSVGIANQQVYDWLVGNSLAGPCSNGGSGTVWTCSLTGPGGLVGSIVWDTAGTSTYAVPAEYLYWRDLTGPTKHPVSGTTYQIGISPILLLNQ